MKKILVIISMMSVSIVLASCGGERTITYKDEQMPMSDAEEKIADELEVENPDLDLELSITEETDD